MAVNWWKLLPPSSWRGHRHLVRPRSSASLCSCDSVVGGLEAVARLRRGIRDLGITFGSRLLIQRPRRRERPPRGNTWAPNTPNRAYPLCACTPWTLSVNQALSSAEAATYLAGAVLTDVHSSLPFGFRLDCSQIFSRTWNGQSQNFP